MSAQMKFEILLTVAIVLIALLQLRAYLVLKKQLRGLEKIRAEAEDTCDLEILIKHKQDRYYEARVGAIAYGAAAILYLITYAILALAGAV